jgi:hypothetical protein
MPLATRYSLLGDRSQEREVTPADADEYSEPVGGLGFRRSDWELAGALEARGGGGDRWRLRGALAKAWRLPGSWKVNVQGEGGACAAAAPRQRRFELGGPLAVASLLEGYGGSDHLLLGRLELVDGRDLFGRLGLPHPDFLVMQPVLFAQAGAAWDDPSRRDVVFSRPPGAAWRGAAGLALWTRIGIPDPDTYARVLFAWPVGRESGAFEVSLAVRAGFDLIEIR